ncbi:MAG: AAA family ATPase [Methanoregula sp.]|nr:AAA family ATPase [Methanoregula sp.]
MTLQEKKIIKTPKMTHITELSIHNFRAIRELTYTPKQINILTGRNNTGKTALLDAIALNIPGYIHKEIENYDIEGPIDFITYGEKTANITSNLNSVTIYPNTNTVIKNYSNIIPEYFEKVFAKIGEIGEALVKRDIKKIIKNDDFRDEYIDLIFEYFDFLTFSSDFGYAVCPYSKQQIGRDKQYDEFSKKMDNKLKKLIKKYEKKNPPQKGGRLNSYLYRLILDPGLIFLREKTYDETKNVVKISHFEKLSFDEVSEEDLVALEDFIKSNNVIKDLRKLSQKNVVYQKEDALVTIPIHAHGDGFVALLNTIRYLLRAKNGILLIEEPENHLHPRYVDIFIENLFEYSKKLNVQVFMSTHSLDLIRSALKYPENNEEKEMLLISKMTSDGQTVEKFDYTVDDGLKVIDELYLDLRGN